MTCFAKLHDCEIKVVAPVPYFPSWFKRNWRWKFSQVARQETRDGIEVYHPRYVMPPKLGMSCYGILMFLSVVWTVAKVRRHFDFDLIDAHYVFPDGFAAVLLGMVLRKKVVISARGSDINQYAGFPILRPLLRYTLGRAEKVIAVSEALRKGMIALGVPADKIVVIPNGVDGHKFYRVPKNEARAQVGLPADKTIILSVGHLTPGKGFDLLIDAFSLIANATSGVGLHLVIVGDGPSKEALLSLARSSEPRESVQFAGAIPHEQLYLWYSAADCFLLASSREGWPNVIMESLACGTPVVATNIGGIPEIISTGDIGVLTRRTPYALAQGISVALRKRWSLEDIVSHAAAYSWTRAAMAVKGVFESAVAGECQTESMNKRMCDKAAV
jgi:glycosyltransferase involved in cell wall biosynthesis